MTNRAFTTSEALRALSAEVERLRDALKGCVSVIERMDTVRHLDPKFPELDAARAALAPTQETT